MTHWRELLEILGGTAALVAGLVYLVKTLVSHFLSKERDAHKIRLSAESAKQLAAFKDTLGTQSKKEIEGFKATLQVLTQNSIVRFTKLHEKRIEILSDMYSLLEDACTSMESLKSYCETGNMEFTKGRAKETAEKNNKLFPFFRKNKLYFGSALSDKIGEVIGVLHGSAFDLVMASWSDKDILECSNQFIQQWPKASEQITALMSVIANEFREVASPTSKLSLGNVTFPLRSSVNKAR
jgi:hypothetical protein